MLIAIAFNDRWTSSFGGVDCIGEYFVKNG
jgi:hypothetical protein